MNINAGNPSVYNLLTRASEQESKRPTFSAIFEKLNKRTSQMSSRNPLNVSLTNEQMFRYYLTETEPLTHMSNDEFQFDGADFGDRSLQDMKVRDFVKLLSDKISENDKPVNYDALTAQAFPLPSVPFAPTNSAPSAIIPSIVLSPAPRIPTPPATPTSAPITAPPPPPLPSASTAAPLSASTSAGAPPVLPSASATASTAPVAAPPPPPPPLPSASTTAPAAAGGAWGAGPPSTMISVIPPTTLTGGTTTPTTPPSSTPPLSPTSAANAAFAGLGIITPSIGGTTTPPAAAGGSPLLSPTSASAAIQSALFGISTPSIGVSAASSAAFFNSAASGVLPSSFNVNQSGLPTPPSTVLFNTSSPSPSPMSTLASFSSPTPSTGGSDTTANVTPSPSPSPAAAGTNVVKPSPSPSTRLQFELNGKPIEPVPPVRKNPIGAKSKEFKRLEDKHKELMKQFRKAEKDWNQAGSFLNP